MRARLDDALTSGKPHDADIEQASEEQADEEGVELEEVRQGHG